MEYVIAPPRQIVLAVDGTDKVYPVRRIHCVGRNYAEHIREMGNDAREPPFFFQKPTDSILSNGEDFPYPPLSSNVHHEIELVVAIGKSGANIEQSDALNYVYGYGVGIDMTRRDLQADQKELRRPWEIGKAFDHSTPCSALKPVSDIGHPDTGRIWLAINGDVKQEGDLAQQIWNVSESIWHLSQSVALEPGDLIMTGTPSGVGPLQRGDHITGGAEGIGELDFKII